MSLAAPDARRIFCRSAANASVPIIIIFAPRRQNDEEEARLPLSPPSSPPLAPAAPDVTLTGVASLAVAPQMPLPTQVVIFDAALQMKACLYHFIYSRQHDNNKEDEVALVLAFVPCHPQCSPGAHRIIGYGAAHKSSLF